jgi:hypothetical protein
MAIPPILGNDVELSDVLSIAFASRIPNQPVVSDRDAAANAQPRVRLTVLRSRRRDGNDSESPGLPGTILVLAHPDRPIAGDDGPCRRLGTVVNGSRLYNAMPGSTILVADFVIGR